MRAGVKYGDVLRRFSAPTMLASQSGLAEFAKKSQVLMLTCHPHLVALAKELTPDLKAIDLPS